MNDGEDPPEWAAAEAEVGAQRVPPNGRYEDEPPPCPIILVAGEDNDPILPREWLLGNTFCRRFISGLIAQGAVGKTALRIVQALALATGRAITGEYVFRRCRVLLVSLEDDLDELRRRVRAAMLHYGITQQDVLGYLFLSTPMGLKVAELAGSSRQIVPGSLELHLRRIIAERQIDLVIIDPFVKAHSVEENDNSAIDAVCIILVRIAADLNCAVDILHHAPKAVSEPGDPNRGRGASAFRDAGRLLYTLTPMTTEAAKQFNISENERRQLIRLDSAKVNIAPPSINARWFRVIGISLGNGTVDYPQGDQVQTVEPWTPPDMWAMMSTAVANKILDQIDAGPSAGRLYSARKQAGPDRAAWRVVKNALPNFSAEQCHKVISTWLATSILEERGYEDKKERRPMNGLFVLKRPG
jgi:hypothetical protein